MNDATTSLLTEHFSYTPLVSLSLQCLVSVRHALMIYLPSNPNRKEGKRIA